MKDSYRMDKTAFSVIDFRDQDPLENTRYWLTKSLDERMAALEYLRQMMYGYDQASTRLQRVLKIVEREKR